MPRVARLTMLLVAVASGFSARAAAGAAPCADGRFLLPDGVALAGPVAGGRRDAIALNARTLGIDSGCSPRSATVKATKKATRLAVRWPACGERRNVQLKATIAAPGCEVLTGSVSARKVRRATFTARRSRCGDQILDPGAGEACDGATGCGTGSTCDGCACTPPVGGSAATPTTTAPSNPGATTTSTSMPAPGGGDPTWALIEAGRAALAAGTTDVALSSDGTLRFRRSTTPGGTREEVTRDGKVIASWNHAGDTTTIVADENADGVPEIRADVTRAPTRRADVSFDFDGDGRVDRRETSEQVGADGLQVTIVTAGGTTGFSTTLVQEAAGTGRNAACTQAALDTAKVTLAGAAIRGILCLHRLGLRDAAALLEGKLTRDGVELRCSDTPDCAQIDVLDALTKGVLAEPVGINLGTGYFGTADACQNKPMVLFHELLHLAFGAGHSPTLDRSTFDGLATDRVYSCTDLCFRPDLATRCECATCLGVDHCDAACDGYRDCGEPCKPEVAILGKSCPSTPCTCCPICPGGVNWNERFQGRASGPVGTVLRINFPTTLGGVLECPGWSRYTCAANLSCCRRESADQPSSITFSAVLHFPFAGSPLDCICPAPAPTTIGIVAQAVTATAGVEDTQTLTCP